MMLYAITQITGPWDCTCAERNMYEAPVAGMPFTQMLSALLSLHPEPENLTMSGSSLSEDDESLELLSTEEGKEATSANCKRSGEDAEELEEQLLNAVFPWVGAAPVHSQPASFRAASAVQNKPNAFAGDAEDAAPVTDAILRGKMPTVSRVQAGPLSAVAGTDHETTPQMPLPCADVQSSVAPIGAPDEALADTQPPERSVHSVSRLHSTPNEAEEAASASAIDTLQAQGSEAPAKIIQKQGPDGAERERRAITVPYAPAAIQHAPAAPKAIPASMTESTAAHAPVEQQIIGGIQAAESREGVKELSLDLYPKELGRIHIRLTLDERKLVVYIDSQKPETHRLLGTRLDTLIARLGLRDARIEHVQSDGPKEPLPAFTPGHGHHGHQDSRPDSHTPSHRQRAFRMPSGEGTMRGPAEIAPARRNIRPADRRLDRTI